MGDVWRGLLEKRIAAYPQAADAALGLAENAGRMLWQALEEIDARRNSLAIAQSSDNPQVRANDSVESLAQFF